MAESDYTAAALLQRIITDKQFRGEFSRDPEGLCRRYGLEGLADEIIAMAPSGMQTLEIRQSRSGLAGVFVAAAIEGIDVSGAIAMLDSSNDPEGIVANSMQQVATNVQIQAVVAPEDQDAPGPPAGVADEAAPVTDDNVPACALCIMKQGKPPAFTPCATCGAPAPLGLDICSVCELTGGAAQPIGTAAGAGPPGTAQVGPFRTPGGPDPSAPVYPGTPPPQPQPVVAAQPAAAGIPGVAAGIPLVPAGPGPSVAPIDPSQMTNTNAGGKLHGSEFNGSDAEGAPGPNGRVHAGYDLFGEENAPIRSPISGTIVEVRPSSGTSGQVFGGTVKVQGADGKVWVFRHVTPGSFQEGQQVVAGQEIAKVSPWTDGPEHTHIEVWKTLEGGYNASNMEDPLDYLSVLYGQGAPQQPVAAVPAAVAAPAAVPPGIPGAVPPAVPGAVPGVVPSAVPGAIPPAAVPGAIPGAVAGVPVMPAVAPAAASIIDNPQISAAPGVAAELRAVTLDPQAVAMLNQLSAQYPINITAVEDVGGQIRLSISAVGGQPVNPSNVAARDMAQQLAAAGAQAALPMSVGTPWEIGGAGFFSDAGVQDHIELTVPGSVSPEAAQAAAGAVPPAVPGAVQPGVAPSAMPPAVPPGAVPGAVAPAAIPGAVAPGTTPPAPAPATAVPGQPAPQGTEPAFASNTARQLPTVPDPSQAAAPGADAPGASFASNTARRMPAIQDPTAVPQQAQAVPGQPQQAGVPVQGVAADQAGAGTPVGDVSAAFDPNDPYPGDANKELLAQWMARTAYRAGLPPELPVMAGLVESGLRNLNYGDADSVGFFQMRVGIWNQGEYAGYPDDPQLQMKWFLDQAVALKEKRIAQGFTDFGSDPAAYGEWIADVERPAEQYRGRYQLRLDEARQLIWSPSATAATL